MGSLLAALTLVLGLAGEGASAPSYVPSKPVRVTWHLPTGNATYSGIRPFIGTAACSWEIPLGSVAVFPDGRVVVCFDRGQLGNDGWIDVFAPDQTFGRDVERAYGARTNVRLYLAQ
ncbi:MAG: hypothetical protein U0556_12125 [Dehalococcoidia bacterium]